MVNYRNRAIDLLCSIRRANDLLFKTGAPAGSNNYFRIREILAAELRKGIGDSEDAYLTRVKEAAEAIKTFGTSAYVPIPTEVGTVKLEAAKYLADFALRYLEGGAR